MHTATVMSRSLHESALAKCMQADYYQKSTTSTFTPAITSILYTEFTDKYCLYKYISQVCIHTLHNTACKLLLLISVEGQLSNVNWRQVCLYY